MASLAVTSGFPGNPSCIQMSEFCRTGIDLQNRRPLAFILAIGWRRDSFTGKDTPVVLRWSPVTSYSQSDRLSCYGLKVGDCELRNDCNAGDYIGCIHP